MTGLEIIALVLRWLHVLSAIALVGSILYSRFAVLPTLEGLPEAQADTVGASLRRHWAKFVMASIGLLLLSGIVNMILTPKMNDFPTEALRRNYNMLIGIKFMLALPVFFIVSTLGGRSANAEKFRQKSRMWLNITVVLMLIIVCLAGYVRSIPRSPKPAESSSTLTQTNSKIAALTAINRCNAA